MGDLHLLRVRPNTDGARQLLALLIEHVTFVYSLNIIHIYNYIIHILSTHKWIKASHAAMNSEAGTVSSRARENVTEEKTARENA